MKAGEEIAETYFGVKVFLAGDTNIWDIGQKLNKKYSGNYSFWLGLSNRFEYAKNRKKGIENAISYIKDY